MNFDFGFGEMTLFEREKLYNYVLNIKPKIILDVVLVLVLQLL